MGSGSTEEVAARCARVADEVDGLVARVRGLPPPGWRGPAADGFDEGLRRAARLLDDGGAAVARAGAVVRHLGVA
ncbi:hypothetical protein [Aquipuribacter hungaricus]|uniref:Uncharacterized protein n=1 Tax=Aquipuribacter hungaricus TaxID=545624 RepID=A0ABV7WH71_9MICO